MKERQVKVQLFILERTDYFYSLKSNSKIVQIIQKCDGAVQEWFYQLGIDNALPEDFEEFKLRLIEFVTNTGPERCTKYKE